jgi:thermitase
MYVASLFLILVGVVAGQGGQELDKPKYKPSVIVCKIDSTTTIEAINQTFGTTVRGHQTQTDCYLLFVSGDRDVDSLSLVISQTPGVIYCTPNFYLSTPEGLQRSDPFADLQFTGDMDTQEAVSTVGLPLAQTVSVGDDVLVAVIDGGVNFAHPYFAGKPGSLISVWDYVDNDSLANDEPGGSSSGHGTFVAGVIRLVAPAADIRVYRVLDTAGQGDGFSIAGAVLRAMDDGCRVINLSMGMLGTHDGLDDALALARQNNIVVIAAAGNDSTDITSLIPFPASRDYCFAVAALDSFDRKADFSNYGIKIDLCAPGTRVYAPYLDTLYAWWDGTSFSTPFVSGLAALVLSIRPTATWEDLQASMCSTAINIDPLNPGLEGLLGSGLIDMPSALGIKPVLRGDLSGNGTIDIEDLTQLIAFLYLDMSWPHPGVAGDLDCDTLIDISDLTVLIGFLYLNGPSPCQGG